MRTINEIIYDLSKAEGELHYLNGSKTVENNEVKNGDVYSHFEQRRVGSKEEIARVVARIQKLNAELEQAKAYEANAPVRQEQIETAKALKAKKDEEAMEKYGQIPLSREQELKIKEDQIEQNRKGEAIKNIQGSYKKGSRWQRFIATINNQRPSKEELMKLSSNELDYLSKIANGETKEQQKAMEELNENMHAQGASYSQIKKAKKNANWNEFMHYMNNPGLLSDTVALDERETRRR